MPKTEHNLLLTNLVLADLLISTITVPLDMIEISTNGELFNHIGCPIASSIHTLLGRKINIFQFYTENIKQLYSDKKICKYNFKVNLQTQILRDGLFVQPRCND